MQTQPTAHDPRGGHNHFFELAFLIEPVDVSQEGAPVCVLHLEDADQRLHEARRALSEDPDCTGLQLLQPRAALGDQRASLSWGVGVVLQLGSWCRGQTWPGNPATLCPRWTFQAGKA